MKRSTMATIGGLLVLPVIVLSLPVWFPLVCVAIFLRDAARTLCISLSKCESERGQANEPH
jgi:hypothetical protein